MSEAVIENGDCRELLQRIEDQSVDAVVCDPPYGTDVPRDGYGRRQVYGGNAVHIQNDQDLSLLTGVMPVLYAKLKPNAFAVIFCSPKNRRGAEDACLAAGFNVCGEVVWDKKSPGLGGGIRYQHETVLLCSKGKPSGKAALFSVLCYHVDKQNRPERHPHEKPVGLLRQLINYVSEPNDFVLDPFAGIGSTLVAAVREGRRCLGFEIEGKYCEFAKRRLRDETARPSLFCDSAEQASLFDERECP